MGDSFVTINNFLSNVQSLFLNVKFPADQLLIVYFTVFGILATIITIGSSLTKEWRQDLIIKYLFKKKFVLFYGLYLFVSFIFFSFIYFIKISSLEGLSFLFLLVLFIWTFIFLILFIKNLDRKSLYNEIYRRFIKETKDAKN